MNDSTKRTVHIVAISILILSIVLNIALLSSRGPDSDALKADNTRLTEVLEQSTAREQHIIEAIGTSEDTIRSIEDSVDTSETGLSAAIAAINRSLEIIPILTKLIGDIEEELR